MAEEHNKSHADYEKKVEEGSGVESQDRGLFDFLKKKEEKPQEGVLASEFDEKVKVSEAPPPYHHHESSEKVEGKKEEEVKHGSLLEKFHRSDSSSSSSSDEEGGEGEERRKKKKDKKGLKDKLVGKLSGDKEQDTSVPVEKYHAEPEHAAVHHPAVAVEPPTHLDHGHAHGHHDHDVLEPAAAAEEKKGFLEKIKDKLPGQQKKTEEVPPPSYDEHHAVHHAAAETPAAAASYEGGEPKEKKGIFEKIKEKLPGYHSKTEETDKEIKEKEKETPSY